MEQAAFVFLGAVLALVGGFIVEELSLRRSRRTAARLVLVELGENEAKAASFLSSPPIKPFFLMKRSSWDSQAEALAGGT